MNQILCLAVVALMAALSLSVDGHPPPEILKEMQQNEEACQASEGASADDLATFKNHQVPSSQTGKCFVGCVMEKMGLMSNGAFSRTSADQKARSMVKEAGMLQKILDQNIECEKEVGTSTDKCVTGPKVMECLEKHMKPMK